MYKLDNVKGMLGAITNGVFQVITLEGTGINTMSDLKGKNIAMGGAGGGTINVANDLWNVLYGFGVDDINATYSSYTDAASNLGDGKVDAVIWQTSAPAPAIAELMAGKGESVKIIGLTDEEIQKVCETYPYYARYEVTPEVYGMKEGAATICLNNILVCRADLEDGLVYDMVKTLVENFAAVNEAYPGTKLFKPETAVSTIPIDIHPGAMQYFKDAGLAK